MHLWDNPRVLPLSLTMPALARRGLCYLGQVMFWDSFIVPYTHRVTPTVSAALRALCH